MRRSRWPAIGAAVAVPLGAGGLSVANATTNTTTNTTPSVFSPVIPTRVLDTRANLGLTGAFTSPVARTVGVTGSVATPEGTHAVVPTGATGVVLNVTGAPTTSNLNFRAGAVTANAVTVALPTNGTLNIVYSAGGATPGPTAHIIADIVGYYTESSATPPGEPVPGPRGEQGESEPPGTDGRDGQQGERGEPGTDGADGATGPQGPIGPQGLARTANRISDQQIALLQWYQDPGAAATVAVGSKPVGVAFDGTNIWVALEGMNRVSKIIPF